MIDKKSIIISIFAGMLLGIITSVFLAGMILNSIGESFHVEGINITIAVNQTQLEDAIRDIPRDSNVNNESYIDELKHEGIYGWFCSDTSTYEPAIYDARQSYINRRCKLTDITLNNMWMDSLENGTVMKVNNINRSYYLENGWD